VPIQIAAPNMKLLKPEPAFDELRDRIYSRDEKLFTGSGGGDFRYRSDGTDTASPTDTAASDTFAMVRLWEFFWGKGVVCQ
jgi:hypothetical protein